MKLQSGHETVDFFLVQTQKDKLNASLKGISYILTSFMCLGPGTRIQSLEGHIGSYSSVYMYFLIFISNLYESLYFTSNM